MQKCSRVSGAFDCAYPASNGGIKDYGSRSSEVRCQKTDLEIRWLSGSDSHRNETSRIDATVTDRKERKKIECRIPTVSFRSRSRFRLLSGLSGLSGLSEPPDLRRPATCDQTQKGADVWKRKDVGRKLNRSCRPSSRPLSVYPERSRRVTEGPSLAPFQAAWPAIDSQRLPIHGVFTN
ncbi:hypothetical protein DSECCO2_629860 [anaerobic digester metagenome]